MVWSALVPLAAAGIGAAANYFGGKSSEDAAKKASKKDYEQAKEFAQNQIQWRTQDAVKAGLHPLVGAGISPASGPPGVQVGDMGNAISNMGANISRGVEAAYTPVDKIAAQAALLDLEQRQANIDLTRSQIAGAQKALLSVGSTAGVASKIAPTVLPVPGSPLSAKVGNPNLATEAQQHYGEPGEWIYGGSALANDWLNSIVGPESEWGPFGSGTAGVGEAAGRWIADKFWQGVDSYYRPSSHGGGGW